MTNESKFNQIGRLLIKYDAPYGVRRFVLLLLFISFTLQTNKFQIDSYELQFYAATTGYSTSAIKRWRAATRLWQAINDLNLISISRKTGWKGEAYTYEINFTGQFDLLTGESKND